jgi:hypothetical protein
MLVGTGLPVLGSGMVRGMTTVRPSTWTVIVSTGAGRFSVVAGSDILRSRLYGKQSSDPAMAGLSTDPGW